MPELPEVEAAVRELRRWTTRRRIVALEPLHRSQARTLGTPIQRRVVGRRITDVTRRGKHQLIHLDDGSTLLVHFRLDGVWARVAASAAAPRHARVAFALDDGKALYLTDPRALCTITWHAAHAPPALTLGPEPEDPALTPLELRERLRTKRGPIKPALLDQRLLAGVGNIYAQEACWHAQINPKAVANRLSVARVEKLLAGLRTALADGHVNAGRYRTGVRTIPFKVYDRSDEPCARCEMPIRRITQAGRGTWYCSRCQK